MNVNRTQLDDLDSTAISASNSTSTPASSLASLLAAVYLNHFTQKAETEHVRVPVIIIIILFKNVRLKTTPTEPLNVDFFLNPLNSSTPFKSFREDVPR